MFTLETCHSPHDRVVAAVVVVVASVVVTVTSTLGQSSRPKNELQQSSPDLYQSRQSDVGSAIPTPLLVQVEGASLETCHFPHNPELCVTISPEVVVVAATVVVVVVASTGLMVGVLVGSFEGRGVGCLVTVVGAKVGEQGNLHASVTRQSQSPFEHTHLRESYV